MRWLRLYLLGALVTGAWWWRQADAARARDFDTLLATYKRLGMSPAPLWRRRRQDRRDLARVVALAAATWPLFGTATFLGMVPRILKGSPWTS